MQVEPSALDGCFTVRPVIRPDERGYFVKTFQQSVFSELGLTVEYPEHFYSQSHKGVIRGLHFQVPPAAQDKFVFCVAGEVFDVAVDIRVGSPTYGQHATFRLSADDWAAAYIPVGFAHGFAAVTESATMAYLVSAEYAPETDTGIRWDSAGIEWPVDSPIVSERDRALVPLSEFDSPFTFEG